MILVAILDFGLAQALLPRHTNMYPGWLPLLGGQSVPEGSRDPVVCV